MPGHLVVERAGHFVVFVRVPVVALRAAGPPFFVPVWFPDILGLVLADPVDWTEVTELVTESYRHLAPKQLVARLDGS